MHPTVKFHASSSSETTTTTTNNTTDTAKTTITATPANTTTAVMEITPPPPFTHVRTDTNNTSASMRGGTRGGRSARQRQQQHTTSTPSMSTGSQHIRRNRSDASANYVTPKSPTEERADSLADRYKTLPCKNYIQGEKECPYEQRCMFAHGEEELRTRAMNVADGLTTEEAIKNHQRSLYNKETPTLETTTRHQRPDGARRFSHSMSGSGRRSSQRSTPHSSSEGFGAKSTTPTDTEDSPLTPVHPRNQAVEDEEEGRPPRPVHQQFRPHSRFASGDSITTLAGTSSSSSLNFSPAATPLVVSQETAGREGSEDAMSSLLATPKKVAMSPRWQPLQQLRSTSDKDQHHQHHRLDVTQAPCVDDDDDEAATQSTTTVTGVREQQQQPNGSPFGIALPFPDAPSPLAGAVDPVANPAYPPTTLPSGLRYQHDPYAFRCLGVERDL